MPYVRITLLGGKSADWLAAISRSLQDALEQTFEVPTGDCFQVFQQCQRSELVYDRDYGGGPRSDEFVLFHITGGRPRSRACKETFYARLVELLADSPGIPPADVMVIIGTTSVEDWSFGYGRTASVPAPLNQ
ncbi:tautomerase family protein [Burkholderia lata]|uniref:4-oxalocrotonate tautomerase n=1 Tax=Burkholderia lata (strain ATCC 17760 / DSM 23089 / LMG 22485 / NCIMB 9086 / R18194 / 383) TaxID=482957 RepID=A0A6P2NDN1_BURL3|nr:tautomerase family protein [Burkholderia lata]VWB89174.1 4-oxalocrotonate tautomerase [Burkholderia lata]VWM07680.1 4-oxalocrotonate tautomerase [Burkholderia lata]